MSTSLTLSQSRRFFLLIFLASAGALTAALVGEKGFGLAPCILCLYERIPYAVAGLVGLAMIALPTSPRLRSLGLWLVLTAFVVGVGLSAFHVGVEQHWWESPACTGGPLGAVSVDDLMAAIQKPVRPACDDIQWSFMGITLAGFNFVYSLVLAGLTLGVTLRFGKGRSAT
jgi:disulfide bond formation protein DsbB